MTERDPADAAHDILAAEAFAVPALDPELHHGPVHLPEDPTGNPEAHDILAAEEFAFPAGSAAHPSPAGGPGLSPGTYAVIALAALFLLRRLLRRRSAPGGSSPFSGAR